MPLNREELKQAIVTKNLGGYLNRLAQEGIVRQADQYRAALEKAAYGDFGRQYGAGLGDITNYLARSGPLADSGAGTALRARLASQLYGQAQSRIQGGYAEYLRQLQQMRLQHQYQMELLKYQTKLQKQQSGGPLGFLGSVAGAALPFVPGLGAAKAAPASTQKPWWNY